MYSTQPKEQSFNVWNVSDQQLFAVGPGFSSAWDVFIGRGFVLLFPWACPARWCPFHPARQLGPDPSDLPLKQGFFQAPAGSSLSPPFSNIPFTPEITLFILRIIVSSWMRELCRHSSELNKSVGIGKGRGGCASGGCVWGVLMSSFRAGRENVMSHL